MVKSRWLRRLAVFALNAGIFVILVMGVLWASGRFLAIHRNGGDQSQSSPVDLTLLPAVASLPILDETGVRNVILLLGDGMGFSHVAIARSEISRMNERLLIERFPFTGWQTTHSLESVYTDSASSASSLATGHKVAYRSVSMAPDGRPLLTVAEAARDAGLAIGVVTDSYLWDATAAAFLTHVESRRLWGEIAQQMASSGAAVLAGERHKGTIDQESDEVPKLSDLLGAFRERGFQVAQTAAELSTLAPTSPRPVLALFEPGEIADPERNPGLSELASFALQKLSQNTDGFFLIVESEEPDTGGHKRDLGRIVRGIRSLNEVAAMAVERALTDRSTLVLVTADHETGGLAILHGDADHRLGVRWSTSVHSAEPVPIYAFGVGAERFSGVKDNTEIARTLSELLGLGMFD